MRTLAKYLFLIPALVALHSAAQTLTTYSTFGEPGNTYNLNSGWIVNGSADPPQPFVGEAFAFTATTSGYLSQIDIAIAAGNSNLANDLANITIAVNNSSRNLPIGGMERFSNVPCPPSQFLNSTPITSLTSAPTHFYRPATFTGLRSSPPTPSPISVWLSTVWACRPSRRRSFLPPHGPPGETRPPSPSTSR